jgi:hypothetical protein
MRSLRVRRDQPWQGRGAHSGTDQVQVALADAGAGARVRAMWCSRRPRVCGWRWEWEGADGQGGTGARGRKTWMRARCGSGPSAVCAAASREQDGASCGRRGRKEARRHSNRSRPCRTGRRRGAAGAQHGARRGCRQRTSHAHARTLARLGCHGRVLRERLTACMLPTHRCGPAQRVPESEQEASKCTRAHHGLASWLAAPAAAALAHRRPSFATRRGHQLGQRAAPHAHVSGSLPACGLTSCCGISPAVAAGRCTGVHADCVPQSLEATAVQGRRRPAAARRGRKGGPARRGDGLTSPASAAAPSAPCRCLRSCAV